MNWQRARTHEKKNERKAAIYQAALALFKDKGYDSVSFNGIAAKAGFTKSNMYRYFSSKDEIFLSVFTELFEKWAEDIGARLQKLEQNAPVEDFAKTWVASLVSFPQFLDLTPLLFIALEKNSTFEQLMVFKRKAKELLFGIVMQIIRVYPDFKIEDAFMYLNMSYAAMSNCWAANSQSDALKKLYQLEEFKELTPNFEYDLTSSLEIALRGIKAGQKN